MGKRQLSDSKRTVRNVLVALATVVVIGIGIAFQATSTSPDGGKGGTGESGWSTPGPTEEDSSQTSRDNKGDDNSGEHTGKPGEVKD
jgi:hypothetical protein